MPNIVNKTVYHNVTTNIGASEPLVDLCIRSIQPSFHVKANNPSFQKSWNIGCEKRKQL